MNVEAIELAIAKLTDLQERLIAAEAMEQFQISFWGTSADQHDGPDPEPGCGFAGCFVGWATHEKWFEPLGLQLAMQRNTDRPTDPRFNYVPIVIEGDGTVRKVTEATDAIASFFGIELQTLDHIILPDHYASEPAPLDVAERLQILLGSSSELSFVAAIDAELEQSDRDDDDDEN